MTGEEKLRFMDRLSTLPRPAVEVDLPRLLGVERYRSKEIWETIPHLPYNVGKALGLALFVFDQGEKTPMARCAMIELMRLMAFLKAGELLLVDAAFRNGIEGLGKLKKVWRTLKVS